MGLTARQEKFCLEYITSGNGTKAYQLAFGTKESSARAAASALLRNVTIQERIAELQSAVEEEQIASAREIQRVLTMILRREVTDTVFLPKGEQVERPAAIRDVLKAAELLGKMQGLFKQEINIKSVTPVVIAGGDALED